MAQSKGTNVLNMRSFILERYGEPGWARILRAVPDADRAVLESMVAVGWYSFDVQAEVLRAIDRELDDDDHTIIAAIGAYEADQDLRRIHRLFLRLANPAYVLEKAEQYWGRFYDSGRWRVERLGPKAARGQLFDFDSVERLFCVYLRAYIKRMFELVGARDPRVTHPTCRSDGAPKCVFQGSWE